MTQREGAFLLAGAFAGVVVVAVCILISAWRESARATAFYGGPYTCWEGPRHERDCLAGTPDLLRPVPFFGSRYQYNREF